MQKETLQVALAGLAGIPGPRSKWNVGINEQSGGLCGPLSNVITVDFKVSAGASPPVGNKAQWTVVSVPLHKITDSQAIL